MACNENIIKNMANEVTRNCQTHNVNVEAEFVAYLIELMLLNPKYGKLFTSSLNRNALEQFVNHCTAMIVRGGTSMNTLRMQFIMRTNYDKLPNLIAKHQDSVNTCLKPLVTEMLDCDPDPGEDAELRKLYRKISIYIVLASGLGVPSIILNLKEGMAAFESVYSLEELDDLVSLSRNERMAKIQELLQLTSGVRLFNRDCSLGGEMIADLPLNLVDAGKACLASLSNSLVAVMQRVTTLTTSIEGRVAIHEETGNMVVDVVPNSDVTLENYHQIFELLIFNRQYEVYIRKLLTDVQSMVDSSARLVEKYKIALSELHSAVKYKAAVPCDTVFPLFKKLWLVWRDMQNTMYLVSTVNVLMGIINGIQEHHKMPLVILNKMLKCNVHAPFKEQHSRHGSDDSFKESNKMELHDVSKSLLKEKQVLAMSQGQSVSTAQMKDRHCAFLGFCAMCLNVGALVPSDFSLGVIKHEGVRYGFCNAKMAVRFNKDPQRYINEVIEYARNNTHIINLLYIDAMVRDVRDVEDIVTKYVPKKLVYDEAIQTDLHPRKEYKEHSYHWDLWKWKRRACQWASIVNGQTHSTQTNYSHLRSETHCQTVEPRDKCLQTMKSTAMSTNTCNSFLYGLRGQLGAGQHSMDLVPPHAPEKPKVNLLEFDLPRSPDESSTSIEVMEADSRDRIVYNPGEKDKKDQQVGTDDKKVRQKGTYARNDQQKRTDYRIDKQEGTDDRNDQQKRTDDRIDRQKRSDDRIDKQKGTDDKNDQQKTTDDRIDQQEGADDIIDQQVTEENELYKKALMIQISKTEQQKKTDDKND